MPKQQDPTLAAASSSIEQVLASKGFQNNDEFNVGAGGQSVFNTSKEVGADAVVFENGVLSNRAVSVTGAQEVTLGDTIPEGSVINILY